MSDFATVRQAVIEDFHLDSSGNADDYVNRAICAALEDLRPMEFPWNQGSFTLVTVADQASYAINDPAGSDTNKLPSDFIAVLGQELEFDHEQGGSQPRILLWEDPQTFRRERWWLNASAVPWRWTFDQDKLWLGPYPTDSVDNVNGFYLKDLGTPDPVYVSSAWQYRGPDGFLIGKEIAQGWQEDNSESSYADLTVGFNAGGAASALPFPIGAGEDDAVYFGLLYPFTALSITMVTPGVGAYTCTWEYWNGSSWTALTTFGLSDGTSNFKAPAGDVTVSFTQPRNWARTTVNSSNSLYFIRARRDAGAVTTDPIISGVSSTTGTDTCTNAWFTEAFEVLMARSAWRYFTTHDRSEKDAAAASGLYETQLRRLQAQRGPKQVEGRIVPFLGGAATYGNYGSRDYYG